TAALAVRPFADASVELLWHRYRQMEASALFRSQNLLDPPARPNGFYDRLGWELDAALISPLIRNSLRVRWSTGFFDPGEAFSPRREKAFLHAFELTAEF